MAKGVDVAAPTIDTPDIAAPGPSVANGAGASCPPASNQRCEGAGWSVNPTPSNPSASACMAKRTIAPLEISSGL